jgi:dCMP deaminase
MDLDDNHVLDTIITLYHQPKNKRLNWDEYFLSIAFLASMRSPCNRLHVGAVIVKNNRIIASGYNGFIANGPHVSIIRDNHEIATIHAEINAICDCASRSGDTKDAIIYITHFPCINCFKSIAACGIKTIIFNKNYKNDFYVEKMAKLYNINLIQYII